VDYPFLAFFGAAALQIGLLAKPAATSLQRKADADDKTVCSTDAAGCC